MNRTSRLLMTVGLLVSLCAGDVLAEQIVIYSGRSKSLVQPIIRDFQKDTGIRVQVRYGSSSQMAIAIKEEGDQGRADLFWAKDAGSLGSTASGGLFAPLPKETIEKVPEKFRNKTGLWVATSGRVRVLAYAPSRVEKSELPQSVFDLTADKWKGRVGWAPGNGSFQLFVTAMRKSHGEKKTEQWLRGMKDNGAKVYAKNRPILRALANEEVDLGLPNHYYLLGFKKADPNYPVEQTFFKEEDPGNLVMVAGIGRLKTGNNEEAAVKFVNYLLAKKAQQFFTDRNFEYPMIADVKTNEKLVDIEELEKRAPKVKFDELDDLEGTLKLLQKVGLR